MGEIHVHEFISADGVIDTPAWTADYGFHPEMGKLIGAMTEQSKGILLGRTTYEMFEPAWSTACTCSSTRSPAAPVLASSRPNRH